MLTINEKTLHVLSFVDASLLLSIYNRTAFFFLASILRFKLWEALLVWEATLKRTNHLKS